MKAPSEEIYSNSTIIMRFING